MNITVLGLWHLGSVTAACCAKHFNVIGLDFDEKVVEELGRGRAPLFEPGLNERLEQGLATGTLRFTTDAKLACAQTDLLWLCYDTPVNDRDESDEGFVIERLRRCIPYLQTNTLILISSQLPVGTARQLEHAFPQFHFAVSPENLRLGKSLDAFEKAERMVVGIRSDVKRDVIEKLFHPFTGKTMFMHTESAEMVKHALNSYLALSITFINEVARLCERVDADAHEVAAGLKSDFRIGAKAYLAPGGPFAGGTLARDVVTLTRLGEANNEPISVIPAIRKSNDTHRGWTLSRLRNRLGNLNGKTIAILGLVYTPSTSTLRRSAAVDLCQDLLESGSRVQAFDPAINELPAQLSEIKLARSLNEAVTGAHATIVCTEWPQFRAVNWGNMAELMAIPVIIDSNRFLDSNIRGLDVEYISVGRK